MKCMHTPCQVPAGSASWHSRHWLDQVPPTVFELYTEGMLLRITDNLINLPTKDTINAYMRYPHRMRC